MLYDAKVDPEHINSMAARMTTRWGPQSALDKASLDYILVANAVFMDKGRSNPLTALRSGIGNMVWREDTALLTVTPGLRVNVPEDDEKMRDHASGVLEPWLAGAAKAAQLGPVWNRLPGDMRALGRAWSCVYPHPDMWANDEMKELVDAVEKAADNKDEYNRATKELDSLRRDRFPIRWRYVDPRQTWTYFDSEHRLCEVIELRKMRADEIESEYGSVMPGDFKGKGDTEVDVYVWANWVHQAVIIGSKNDPKVAKEFEHGLGRSPYILMESELLPENDRGWRWAGALFGAEDMIDAFDEIVSDLRHNHHENTRTPRVVTQDPEYADEAAKVNGRPTPLKPDTNNQYNLVKGEEIGLAPTVEINPQSLTLLQELKGLIFQRLIRPVERGEAKSGTSQVQFTTAVQVAEREFDPAMEAIKTAYEEAGQLLFASVEAIGKRYEGAKVWVFPQLMGKNAVGITADDVKGWKRAIQARATRAIPIDRNSSVSIAQALLAMGVSKETVFEQELGYENAEQIIKLGREEILEEGLMADLATAIRQKVGQDLLQLTETEEQELVELFQRANPELQEIIRMGGGAPAGGMGAPAQNGSGLPQDVAAALANVGRTGVPENPQMPGGSVLG